MTRFYYAIEHTYGGHVLQNGGHVGAVVRFGSAAERDEWIISGNAFFTRHGMREALLTRNRLDRRAISAYAEQVKYYGDPTP